MKAVVAATVFLLSAMFMDAKASSIAVVDVEEIAKNSVAMQKLTTAMTADKDKWQKIFRDKEIKLSAKKDEIASKSAMLSKDAIRKQVAEFEQEVYAFQEEVKQKEAEMQQKVMKALSILNDEVIDIISAMKKEDKYKDYKMIVNSSALLYYEPEDDISAEVLKRLNKKLPAIKNLDK